MDRELRHVVARVEAARLAPDLLAEAVGVDQFVGADRDRVEPLKQPELLQFLDRVRQRVDADAELAHALGLLEQLAVDAARMQHQSRGETANSAADDDDLHGQSLTLQTQQTMAIMVPCGGTAKHLPVARLTAQYEVRERKYGA